MTREKIQTISDSVRIILNNPHFSLILDTEQNKLFVFTGKNIRAITAPKNIDIVTPEWVINKVENNYKNLRPIFQKLNIQGHIYYTSFGFSYDMFFRSQKDFDADIAIIKEQLQKLNIKYRCEYSDAHWVYRFIISKDKNNLQNIKAIK